jgi:hypothetical protein
VPAGTFYRTPPAADAASISAFRLGAYQITVVRFHKFVDACLKGWQPAAGWGKHTHLNGGKGLTIVGGGYESGWNTAWTTSSRVRS